MRAYAAARWAVFHSTSIDDTIGVIEDARLWSRRVKPSDRDEIFAFLAEMLPTCNDIQQVRAFGEQDYVARGSLLAELKRVAKKRPCSW